jgi:hypothetical protein
VQPREHGPLTADNTSYGSDRADGVLGRGHAEVDPMADRLCPLGDSVKECHASSEAPRDRHRTTRA